MMKSQRGTVLRRLRYGARKQHDIMRSLATARLWLERSEIEACDLLPWGSNYTFIVLLRVAQDEAFGIYKPRRGEMPLWDFPLGTLYRRECAAFTLADALGWPLVPPTVARGGPYGVGSLQIYVPSDPRDNYFSFGGDHQSAAQEIALFDCVANNADRKAGHLLLDDKGQVWAIDHGLTFHQDPKLRTVIWEFAGQAIPDPLLGGLAELRDRLRLPAGLFDELARHLAVDEVQALLRRVDGLLESRVFPLPGVERPVPWPPV